MTQSRIQNLIRVFKDIPMSKLLLTYQWEGYLIDTGWIKSYKLRKPVGPHDEPLPWVTYSFIDFISNRLDKTMVVLEYGSGNSTLYYGQRVRRVYAVEHDQDWFLQISAQVPTNVTIRHVELVKDGDYSRITTQINESFDVIVVDGRDRVNCVKHGQTALSDRGVLVLDDSERPEYAEAISFMKDKAYRQIDFWGIAPGVFYRKCTTLFYKDGNCVAI